MMLTRNLIDLWDPELKLRNREKRISIKQIIFLPSLFIGILIVFPIDILTLPYQLKHIYRDD